MSVDTVAIRRGDEPTTSDADESTAKAPTKKSDDPDADTPAAPVSKIAANEVQVRSKSFVAEPDSDGEAQPVSSVAAVQRVAPEPAVPSLRPWPTAFDPTTVVTYVSGLVTSLVTAVLSPFAHYRAVFASLRAHGLEPLVTVNHFTLQTWVNDPITARPLIQLGLPAPAAGWLTPSTPVEFEKFAAYVTWKYGDQVDDWAAINEPFSPILTEFFAIPGIVPAWPPGVIRPGPGVDLPRQRGQGAGGGP